MHDGIVRRGPARRHARRGLHRDVKQLGVGPPRCVQLGVVGLHRGVSSSAWVLTVACSSAWGRTVVYISSTACVGQFGRGATWRTFLRVSLEG